MNSTAAVLAAALVSGTAMYTVGARTSDRDADAVLTTPAVAPVMETRAAYRPANVVVTRPAATRRVSTVTSSAPREVVVEEARPQRSWKKTALIIGGSAAGGAGVGAMVGGKKGAITGAAIGGGAASIYEAIRRND